MAELTPGLYVNSWIPPGRFYEMNAAMMGLTGLGGSNRAVAISEADWKRIPGAKREQFLDDFTRRFAEHGTIALEAWLKRQVAPREEQQRG